MSCSVGDTIQVHENKGVYRCSHTRVFLRKVWMSAAGSDWSSSCGNIRTCLVTHLRKWVGPRPTQICCELTFDTSHLSSLEFDTFLIKIQFGNNLCFLIWPGAQYVWWGTKGLNENQARLLPHRGTSHQPIHIFCCFFPLPVSWHLLHLPTVCWGSCRLITSPCCATCLAFSTTFRNTHKTTRWTPST